MIFGEILKRLERAAVNGERLHLDVPHVQALVDSPIYLLLLELKGREFAASWREENQYQDAASTTRTVQEGLSTVMNLERSGSGTGKNGTCGISAGLMAAPHVEKVSVSEVAQRIIRHKRRRTP
jgi:hypothetical protein